MTLPEYKTPWDRHLDAEARGDHPTVTEDDSWRSVIHRGLTVKNGTELISIVNSRECPVCGETGLVSPKYVRTRDGDVTDPSFAFVRWADSESDAVSGLANHGWFPIVCSPPGSSGSPECYLGVANRSAVEEYHDYAQDRQSYRKFKESARSLAHETYPENMHGRGLDHGLLLATIFEQLGAVDYDPRDFRGRTNVTKAHLLVIIRRLMQVEFDYRDDWPADSWLAERDYAIGSADVQWHVPEWVEEDDLFHSGDFRSDPFE